MATISASTSIASALYAAHKHSKALNQSARQLASGKVFDKPGQGHAAQWLETQSLKASAEKAQSAAQAASMAQFQATLKTQDLGLQAQQVALHGAQQSLNPSAIGNGTNPTQGAENNIQDQKVSTGLQQATAHTLEQFNTQRANTLNMAAGDIQNIHPETAATNQHLNAVRKKVAQQVLAYQVHNYKNTIGRIANFKV